MIEEAPATERKRPGPKKRGSVYQLTIYLKPGERDALFRYCDEQGTTRAAAVRQALALLTRTREEVAG